MELLGWKAIAAHLGVSVRTAQRYEATLGLPVVRTHRPGGVDDVRAEATALDAWLTRTATRRGEALGADAASAVTGAPWPGPARSDAGTAPPRATTSLPIWRVGVLLVLAVGVVAVALVSIGAMRARSLPAARPIVPSHSPPSNIVGDSRGQLVGRIAVDLNGNGEWDAGERFVAEPGRTCPNTELVAGFVIRWTGDHRGSSAPMNCNPEPFYHGRLPAGRYTATLEVPEGWRVTSPATATVDVEPGKDTHLWFAVVRTDTVPQRPG